MLTRTVDLGQTAKTRDVVVLPGFDEFMLGYADRSAVLKPKHRNMPVSLVIRGDNGQDSGGHSTKYLMHTHEV